MRVQIRLGKRYSVRQALVKITIDTRNNSSGSSSNHNKNDDGNNDNNSNNIIVINFRNVVPKYAKLRKNVILLITGITRHTEQPDVT